VSSEGDVDGQVGAWNCSMQAGQKMDRSSASWINSRSAELQRQVQEGAEVVLPVISHYGTERLWLQAAAQKINTLGPESRFAGYHNCLDTASNQQRLVQWFKTQEFAALQQKREIAVLEACRKVIIECVPDASHVYFDVSHDQLIVNINGEGVPFNYLSDGYRNMLAMAADIAVKCATLNPHLQSEAAAKTPGIVLIDEIDLHLHPKWQRRIVGDLMKAFPLVQFVATSHSPFVIQSLPEQPGVGLINLDDREK
jgi:predicted ATP-binding protein involved in virulence